MGAESEPVTVGVLSLHNSKETKAILNAIEALGHEPAWLREENLTMDAGPGGPVVRPAVDVVINRLLLTKETRPSEPLGLAHAFTDVPVVNPPEAALPAMHKFAAAAKLADAGVPVPRASLAFGATRVEDTADRVTGGAENPVAVHKYPIATHGEGTVKLREGEWAPQRLDNRQGILQQLIEDPRTTHHDLRVYVVGDDVIGAMYRFAPEDDWRTNVAQGGRVEDATDSLPEAARRIAREATAALELDFAGVDLIKGPEGWYVLEVNATAGFKGFFAATGTSPAPYIAAGAIERVGGAVDAERVEELAGTLDDSVPACKPPLDRPPHPEAASVGFTERVQVVGRTDSKAVVAKADTGASRTSIDMALAGEVGAGPIVDVRSVKTGSGGGSTRPLVEAGIRVGDYTHRLRVNVEDRSHMDHPVLLGRDVLEHYSVNVRRRFERTEPAEEDHEN